MASWFWTAALSAVLLTTGCSRQSDLPTLGQIPQFRLTDQSNRPFDTAEKLTNTVWIANFMFTNCPGPCPRMSSQMKQIQTALTGTGIKLVSITVDPERDTPKVLADYAAFYNARPGIWYFLTGDQADLNHLSKDAFKLNSVDGTLEHSTRFVLLDRKARIRGYYLSSESTEIPRLIADARELLKERT
jgi:protein SCO1